MIEQLVGPGYIAIWDQGLADARAKLADSCAFVLVTVNRETRSVDFAALSRDIGPEGVIQLLDSTIEGCLKSVEEIEESFD